MTFLRQTAIRAALELLYFSRAYRLAGDRLRGVGLVLTLHHVRPARDDPFQPNRSLEVTPEFLEQTILELRREGFDFVSLDELHRRLCAGRFDRRFVAVTFDDGYQDNRQWAYPILKRHQVPFAIFVASDFADGRGHLWWRTVETAVAAGPQVTLRIDGTRTTFACRTTRQKYAAARAIDRQLSCIRTEQQLRAAVEALAADAGIDPSAQCAALCMNWQDLWRLAADPLVTIGAHTASHPDLRRIAPGAARREIGESIDRIQRMLGLRPAHFAYPFGRAGAEEFALAAELGLKTAVTTRAGVLMPSSRYGLMSLPRISLNGHFQRLRHVQVLASGLPTAPAALRQRHSPA